MSTFCMDMSSYKIERDNPEASTYSHEVLNAGWVPTLGLREVQSEHAGIPASLADADVEAFLRKMYAHQR